MVSSEQLSMKSSQALCDRGEKPGIIPKTPVTVLAAITE